MNAFPFTRKFIWLLGALGIISMPVLNVLPKEFGGLNLLVWPLTPAIISGLVVLLYCRRNGWRIEGECLFKGGDKSVSLDLSDLEWILFGKPLTDINSKRYELTKGSSRHQYWKVIDNTVCLKSKSGQYLMLDVHFYNNSKKFLSTLRNSINCSQLELSELNDKELRAFKFGHSNNIFRL